MKKAFRQFFQIRLFVMPVTVLLFCSWENPGMYTYANRKVAATNNCTDTLPNNKSTAVNATSAALSESMAMLNKQMEKIKMSADKEISAALAAVDVAAIEKQVQESLDKINWDKVQQDANVSIEKAKAQIAKVDFTTMQKDMQALQENFTSEAFKSQLSQEKLQHQVDAAMANAKKSIEKANEQLQQTKAFTDALAADGLIDKKKGYAIEWKDGDLYINQQKQTKDIADKYRKYENTGKIRMMPGDAEHF